MTAANQPRSNVRFDLPGGESTAAALRRVEQERDEARAELEQAGNPVRVRYGTKVVHKLMHAEYDPAAGWRYLTGCGHPLSGSWAALTTHPATCEWCTA